jgi:hypothetical protein
LSSARANVAVVGAVRAQQINGKNLGIAFYEG